MRQVSILTHKTSSLLLVALLFCGTLCTASVADAAMTPSETLRNTIDHVLMTLKNPDYQDMAKRPPLRAEIEREIDGIFDYAEFSRRTLGTYWSDFTPDQQKRFEQAFARLLSATYLDKVNGYNGEKVVYVSERFTQNNRLAEVQTTITFGNGQIVPVAYRMVDRNGVWRVYDVMVENVGLTSNYRAQFKDILATAKPDELISRVEKRVEEVRLQSQRS